MTEAKRLFLRLGDGVIHKHHEEWGDGVVVEEMTSSVPGGTCLVRVFFDDGKQRTFNNDMENSLCCYYFGMRRLPRLERGQGTRKGARRLRLS